MYILSFDTSNLCLNAAILKDYKLLSKAMINVNKRQNSELLLPIINSLLKKVNISISQIDLFVVADGPGSYTGIRIAVTTAKTLAWTLNKKLICASSLASIASNISSKCTIPIVPIFNARRNNVFAGIYRWDNGHLLNMLSDRYISIIDLVNFISKKNFQVLFVGDTDYFKNQLKQYLGNLAMFADSKFNFPDAFNLACLSKDLKCVNNIYTLVPNYLRKTEAERTWLNTHSKDLIDNKYIKEI